MKLNKDNKVILDSLTKEEAELFIVFLQLEIWRHEFNIREAEGFKERNPHKFWGEIWDTAITRHQIDINQAQALIDKVREKFKGEI